MRAELDSNWPDLLGDWSHGGGPLYRCLARALRAAIADGVLAPGDVLPSERRLAGLLAVSRATVIAAYDDLRGDGLADSRRGSGTRVRRAANSADSGARARRAAHRSGGSIFRHLVDAPAGLISLATAVDEGVPEVATELALLAEHDLPYLLSQTAYQPRGLPVLRERLAAHLTAEGPPTTPDELVITTGAAQALALIAAMYLRRGARVVVEAPSWPGCLDVLTMAGAQPQPVPMDDEGIEPVALRAALADGADLLYVMPTYHNPTGVLMSKARRRRIAELAADRGVPLVEDNAYCGGPALGLPAPVCAVGRAEVLSVGSLGKALWGGLRVGWVRAPAEIAERLAGHKALADLGSPVLSRAATAWLLPALPDIAARRARDASLRRRALEELLAEHLPQWSWRTPDGGSALWIELPGTDARVFAQVALRHGVEVIPGRTMDPTGAHDSYIRVPYTFPPATLIELTTRLTRAWTDWQRHGAIGPGPGTALVV